MNQRFWQRLGFLFALLSGLSAHAQDGDQFIFRLHGAVLGDVTFFNTIPVTSSDQSSSTIQAAPSERNALWASGQTRGMVHWFKRYKATFRSDAQPDGIQSYRVIAVDAGIAERRYIQFPLVQGGIPTVIEFSDRTQAQPLLIDPTLDRDRIDPLLVLQNLINQLNQEATCDAVYRVYDGKRRYTVSTQKTSIGQPLNEALVDEDPLTTQNAPRTIQCQVSLQTATNNQSNGTSLGRPKPATDALSTETHEPIGFWPFKQQEQTMTIDFKRHAGGYRFAGFDINSPFGKIKGRPVP